MLLPAQLRRLSLNPSPIYTFYIWDEYVEIYNVTEGWGMDLPLEDYIDAPAALTDGCEVIFR